MKGIKIFIAIVLFVLPIVGRGMWFYRGLPQPRDVDVPDYGALTVPKPPISNAEAEESASLPGRVVLVDYYHGNQFVISEIEALTAALSERGVRTEVDTGYLSLNTYLKYVSAYVIISPTVMFTIDEVKSVQRFVERGGRLLILTDPTRNMFYYDYYTYATFIFSDVNSANNLLSPFDIVISDDHLYNLVNNEGNYRNVLFEEFNDLELTQGLEQIAFYATHSVHTDSGTDLFISDENTFSSQTDANGGFSAAALSADGNVLAVGDFTFFMPPYNQVADNALFIDHIVDFLLEGTRVFDLTNFPYLFNAGIASLLPTEEVILNSDIFGPLASLQSTLRNVNVDLTIVEEDPGEGDLIVLGLFSPTEDLTPYLEPFGLELKQEEDDESKDTILVPGFGELKRSGLGILLFRQEGGRNILISLADTADDLPMLISVLSYGDISSCLVRENIAVCGVGFADKYYQEPWIEGIPEEPVEEEPPIEEMATPIPVVP
ncbi:MAG: DUF4350 domain-containing protein [Chloroflexota bacterium]